MLIKSALITQASGSLGGMTAAHNRAGMYLRARTIPVDPGSTSQQLIRAQMQAASVGWFEDLTDLQRVAWDNYAANVPLIGRLGDPIYITGANMYIRSRVAMAYYAVPYVDDGPANFTLATFTPITVAISEAAQLVSVSFTNTDEWANEDDAAMMVAQSRMVNSTVNYFKGPFIQRGKIDGDSVTPPTSPTTFPTAYPAVEGQRFFAHIRACRADGRLSTKQIATGVVAA